MKYILLVMLALTAFMLYMWPIVWVMDFADGMYRAGHTFLSMLVAVNAMILWVGIPIYVWYRVSNRGGEPNHG